MKPDRFLCTGRSSIFVLVSFSVLGGGSQQVYANPLFSVQSLGTLSASGLPTALNNSGAAVGYFVDNSGQLRPLTFGAGGASQLPGSGEALGINNAGTIVGTTISNYTPEVAEWSNGQLTNLNIPGYGFAINSNGQIAGGGYVGNNFSGMDAFVWTNGTLNYVGTLGGYWDAATAINDKGQVAGTSANAQGAFHAFFDAGSKMVDLGTLGGLNSYGAGINNRGEVVGSAQLASNYLNAFAWSSNGMVDLGTLGGSSSEAYGINDAGEVVGDSYLAGNAQNHGFLDLNGVMLDLNSLIPASSGWTITDAYAINNAGDILGTGVFAGSLYAVELNPAVITPEPASLLLLGIGLPVLVKLGRLKMNRARRQARSIA
jgi:probable HAF family extracellular repeat protein